MSGIRDVRPAELSSSNEGLIGRRQSTYWDIESRRPTRFKTRVHFLGKVEFSFASHTFSKAQLTRVHPVLLDYKEQWFDLYINDAPSQPDNVLTELADLTAVWSHGWRSVKRYENLECRQILHQGHGLLLRGPSSLIHAAEALLARVGARPKLLEAHQPAQGLQALCLDLSFVVARHFDFEALAE
jgi:hypothetical protein